MILKLYAKNIQYMIHFYSEIEIHTIESNIRILQKIDTKTIGILYKNNSGSESMRPRNSSGRITRSRPIAISPASVPAFAAAPAHRADRQVRTRRTFRNSLENCRCRSASRPGAISPPAPVCPLRTAVGSRSSTESLPAYQASPA